MFGKRSRKDESGNRDGDVITQKQIVRCPANLAKGKEKLPASKYKKVGDDFQSAANVGSESANVRHLLNKIDTMKKYIQELEAKQQRTTTALNKSIASQTLSDIKDFYGAQTSINNCKQELMKLTRFLQDENSWWMILKEREITCCGQTMPHLHGYLDGTAVTLKLSEEGPEKVLPDFSTTHQSRKGKPTSLKGDVLVKEKCKIPRKETFKRSYTVSSSVTPIASGILRGSRLKEEKRKIEKDVDTRKESVEKTKNIVDYQKSEMQVKEKHSSAMKKARDKYRVKATHMDEKTKEKAQVLPKNAYLNRISHLTFDDTSKPIETFRSENAGRNKVNFMSFNIDQRRNVFQIPNSSNEGIL